VEIFLKFYIVTTGWAKLNVAVFKVFFSYYHIVDCLERHLLLKSRVYGVHSVFALVHFILLFIHKINKISFCVYT